MNDEEQDRREEEESEERQLDVEERQLDRILEKEIGVRHRARGDGEIEENEQIGEPQAPADRRRIVDRLLDRLPDRRPCPRSAGGRARGRQVPGHGCAAPPRYAAERASAARANKAPQRFDPQDRSFRRTPEGSVLHGTRAPSNEDRRLLASAACSAQGIRACVQLRRMAAQAS